MALQFLIGPVAIGRGGNGFKAKKEKFGQDLRKKFFTTRVARP